MSNGNRAEMSPICSVIMSDLKNLENPGAGVRYVNYKLIKSRTKYKKRCVVFKNNNNNNNR